MKRLIVNADDFGFTAGVNRAIIEAHQQGIVTSATIMVNMNGFEEAVRLARENPSLGVGLHFNITQGKPVAPAEKIRGLLTNQGEFPGTSTAVARRLLRGGLTANAIATELRAQIEKALDAGLKLTHVDSHKHAHALPQVFAAIMQTIPPYGIGAVRLQRERWRLSGQFRSAKLLKQSLVAAAIALLCPADRERLRVAGIRTTEAFIGITQTGFWTKEWLEQVIDSLPDGVSELMCHPGYVDDDISQIGTRLIASRQQELHLLLLAEIQQRLQSRKVKLINYADLQSVA